MAYSSLLRLGDKLIDFSKVTFVNLEPLGYTEHEVEIHFTGGTSVRIAGEEWQQAIKMNYLPVSITTPSYEVIRR